MSSEDTPAPKIAGTERRKRNIPVAIEQPQGRERRRKVERRRQVDPTTCDATIMRKRSPS